MNPAKFENIKDLINGICERHNNGLADMLVFKNDTNIDVIVLNNCVIRFYSPDNYNSKLPILNRLNENNNLERILENNMVIIDEQPSYGYTVSEILTPLINSDNEFQIEITPERKEALIEQINQALGFLHQNNILHNDVSIDNIGFRESDQSFVLFDFGASKIVEDTRLLDSDFQSFHRSLRFHRLI
jgi:serine/threonine protein kinase